MKKILILILTLLLFVFVIPVLADSPIPTPTPPVNETPVPVNPDEIYDLPQFLDMLAGPLGWLALGVFTALVLRKFEWYNKQTSDIKRSVQVSLTIALSVISWAIFNFVPASVLVDLTPIFKIAAGSILTFSGSDLTYLFFVKPNKK